MEPVLNALLFIPLVGVLAMIMAEAQSRTFSIMLIVFGALLLLWASWMMANEPPYPQFALIGGTMAMLEGMRALGIWPGELGTSQRQPSGRDQREED
jgi:hypothetical protein